MVVQWHGSSKNMVFQLQCQTPGGSKYGQKWKVFCVMAGWERASALPWGRTECPRLLRSTTRAAWNFFDIIWSKGCLEKNVAYNLQKDTCTLIVIICNMNINICSHCIRESTYSKAWSHYRVRLSTLNLDFPSEVNSNDICIDSEDIGSDSAFIHICVKIPIVADHVCLKYLEQLCFVPVVVWCQLRIPESPSRPELELNTIEDG